MPKASNAPFKTTTPVISPCIATQLPNKGAPPSGDLSMSSRFPTSQPSISPSILTHQQNKRPSPTGESQSSSVPSRSVYGPFSPSKVATMTFQSSMSSIGAQKLEKRPTLIRESRAPMVCHNHQQNKRPTPTGLSQSSNVLSRDATSSLKSSISPSEALMCQRFLSSKIPQ